MSVRILIDCQTLHQCLSIIIQFESLKLTKRDLVPNAQSQFALIFTRKWIRSFVKISRNGASVLQYPVCNVQRRILYDLHINAQLKTIIVSLGSLIRNVMGPAVLAGKRIYKLCGHRRRMGNFERALNASFALLSFAKLPESCSVTGNDKIGNYQFLNRWPSTTNNLY